MSASRDAGAYLVAYDAAFRALWRVGADIDVVRDAAEERARQYVRGKRNGRAWARLTS